jgi:hypothetical protein
MNIVCNYVFINWIRHGSFSFVNWFQNVSKVFPVQYLNDNTVHVFSKLSNVCIKLSYNTTDKHPFLSLIKFSPTNITNLIVKQSHYFLHTTHTKLPRDICLSPNIDVLYLDVYWQFIKSLFHFNTEFFNSW